MHTPTHDSVKARIARAAAPGYSWCLRCGMPWTVVDGHTTDYGSHGRGCFPLCELCWCMLGRMGERWPYYKTLLDEWDADQITRNEVMIAVAREQVDEARQLIAVIVERDRRRERIGVVIAKAAMLGGIGGALGAAVVRWLA